MPYAQQRAHSHRQPCSRTLEKVENFCFRVLLWTWVFVRQHALPVTVLQLVPYAAISVFFSCIPCFPPCTSFYADTSPEWAQSILLSKLWASVGLVLKSCYVKGRKNPASLVQNASYHSKHSELLSYCHCRCAPRPKSNTYATYVAACNLLNALSSLHLVGDCCLKCCHAPPKQWFAYWSKSGGSPHGDTQDMHYRNQNPKVHTSVEFGFGFRAKFRFIVLWEIQCTC